MPARTYAEHKADADASLPSPPVVWAVLEVSESEYNHEHVAAASMLFNESVYDYVGRVEVINDVEQWGVEIKGAGSVVIGQASWPEARRVFAAWWEGSCDATRGRVASNAYGKDAVGNDLEASRAKLTSLVISQGNLVLTPAWDPDIFEYTGTSTGSFQAMVERDAPRSVVRWRIPASTAFTTEGTTQTVAVPDAGVVLAIIVTSENGEITRTYLLTVTRV